MIKKLLYSIIFLVAALCSYSCSADLIAPKEGDTHPFVYLSDEYISNLYDASGNVKDEYAASYNYIKTIASRPLPAQPEGGYITTTISNQLVSRALMYALGEFDEDHAKETVAYTIKYVQNARTSQTYSISMYKDYGTNAIQCGALVYDWCYNVLTDEQKTTLPEAIMAIYDIQEDTNGDKIIETVQPCRPDNASSWGDCAGSAVGQPIIYNSIAATALYDYNKDAFYNKIMPKIQGDMAKIVKMYGEAGALSDGSLAYTREYYTYYIYVLFQRLGASEAQLDELYGDQRPLGYKVLYSRLPYGAVIKQGDDFYQCSYKMNTYLNGSETTDMGLLATIYGDEYLHFQFAKVNRGAKSYLQFLTLDNEVGFKLPDDLPLVYETKEPRSEILARTSWQDGITSKTVSAFLNMNERRTGDHDHGHVGEFQLYYKGPLTMPGGVYEGNDWGKYHWAGYYTKTSSANCMLLVDPSESFTYYSRVLSNDGSQRYAKYDNNAVFFKLSEHQSEITRWATTENTFIGPNKNTPAFSYIKGDLTKAYSSNKMESYKRSMVFMDTFNDTYPGALIVFDRMVSKDKTFKKKWLLQAVSDPHVSGNQVTITNTQDGANGKLVNTTLMPENVTIEKIGGIDKYFAAGVEYPAPVVHEDASEAYRSGFRTEISPTVESAEDIFLNAMYVTDADGNAAQLPMVKENTNEFVGVTTLDRMVMFSKSGNAVSASFTITVRDNNAGGNMLVLLTDIANGKWKVYGSGTSLILESVSGDGCLTFSAAPGTYTVSPVANTTELSNLNWEEVEKENIGDFAVRLDSSYMYLPDETYYFNDTAYISVDTAREIGADITVNGNKLTIKTYDNTSTVNVGDSFFVYNNDYTANMAHSVITRNGKIYLPICDMNLAFAISTEFVPSHKLLVISKYQMIENENLLRPVIASGNEKVQFLYDGIRGEAVTYTSPIHYYFGETPKQITKIHITGTNSASGITIYGSVDGKNYYKITGPAEVVDSWSHDYTVDATVRYIKFALSKNKYTEIAVYGINSNEKLAFYHENIKKFDLNSEFHTSAYIKSGFSSAALYVGNTKIYTFTENETGHYNVDLVPDELTAISRGKHSLKLVAYYGGKEFSISRDIEFVERESIKIIEETFSGTYMGHVFGNKNGYYFARNPQNATESLSNGVYTLTFNNAVSTSAPFMFANGFAYDNGVYVVYLDIELSSENASVGMELRDKTGAYPASGPGYALVSRRSGKFNVKAIIDNENKMVRTFVKKAGTDEEYAVVAESNFDSNGLGQIRFSANNAEGNSYVAFDNFTAYYYYNISGSSSLPSEDGSTSNEFVTLTANIENADEVAFSINNEVIKTFSKSSDGNYEFKTSFEDFGTKTFDVYMICGNNTIVESKTFNYNPYAKINAKSFAGPFTTKIQSDGYCWENATNASTYYTGRVAFEGDITLTSATDMVYFELGGASDYSFTYGGSNYITLHDALGYGEPTPLFGSNGKILDTDISYKINEPMHIKYVCDTISDKYEFYVDGELIATKNGEEIHGKKNLVSAKIVGCKVRPFHVDVDEDGAGCPVFENVKTYQEVFIPGIESITSKGVSALASGGYVISKDNSFQIKFTDSFEKLDTSLVKITQNGKFVDFKGTYDSENSVLTISQADITDGIIKVTVSPDAKAKFLSTSGVESFSKICTEISTFIHVTGNENISISPVHSGEQIPFYKYLNVGGTAKKCLFTLSQYTGNGSLKLFDISSGTIKPNTYGVFRNIPENIISGEAIARIWSDNFEPIYSGKLVR